MYNPDMNEIRYEMDYEVNSTSFLEKFMTVFANLNIIELEVQYEMGTPSFYASFDKSGFFDFKSNRHKLILVIKPNLRRIK